MSLSSQSFIFLIEIIIILTIIMGIGLKYLDKTDKNLLFSLFSLFILLYALFHTSSIAIQLMEGLSIIIIIVNIIFSCIYPKIFITREEQYYQPREETIWERKEQNNEIEQGKNENAK